jgi:AcrR family transcriptional regulator
VSLTVAHDVVKRVGDRSYRYRVESYRDPASGKVRGRWTYLGRVAGEGAQPPRERRSSAQTRERLLGALELLLEEQEFGAVTAGAIARAAGLAHGTFYRYFADKRQALRAAVERARELAERTRPSFEPPFGSAARERARVRSWVTAVLDAPFERRGLTRTWFVLSELDLELLALRRTYRARTVEAFASYLERLRSAGTVDVPQPRELAAALLILLEGTVRRVLVEGETFEPDALDGVVEVFDRAIFNM